jgi:hypothetical protein
MFFGSIINLFGGDPFLAARFISPAITLCGLCAAVWVVLRRPTAHPYRGFLIAFSAIVVCSPILHPWYVMWLLVSWAVLGITEGLALRFYALIQVFLIGYILTDTMDISVIVQNIWVIQDMISISLLLLSMYFILFDPKTRSFFIRGALAEPKQFLVKK